MMEAEFEKVATTSELQPGAMKMVHVAGDDVCLINLAGKYYAIGNVCSHMGGPLNEGTLEDQEVECPLHGSRFNVMTGENTEPPAEEPVKSYTVHVEGQDVLVGP